MRLKQIFILLIAFALTASLLHGFIIANESDNGYEGDGTATATESVKTASSIRSLVAESAGYYLRAYSGMVTVLNNVEMAEIAGLNYAEMQVLVNDVAANIENTKATYYTLHAIAAVTPYKTDVIDVLKNFDYKVFQKEKNLNPAIFDRVKKLLEEGDITGVYAQLHEDVCNISLQLRTLKESVDGYRFPDVSLLLSINQNFSQSILFGQYVAEVFLRIK